MINGPNVVAVLSVDIAAIALVKLRVNSCLGARESSVDGEAVQGEADQLVWFISNANTPDIWVVIVPLSVWRRMS